MTIGPLLLCLGSTLSALFGLLALNLAARQGRWKLLWLLLTAVLLIGAGFGTAETVYQAAIERADYAPQPSPTPPQPPSPLPSPTPAALSFLIPSEQNALDALDNPPRYNLDVTVDFDALTVVGTVDILYTNNERVDLDSIYLRLYPNAEDNAEGETRIDAVNIVDAVNIGGNAADWSFEDVEHTVLQVPLPAPLRPGDQATLQIAFSVTVPRRSDYFGYEQGVMSLGYWYPILAVYDDEGWNLDQHTTLGEIYYSDTGVYSVRITVPEQTVIASSGVEVSRVLHRPPRATITYVSEATRDFSLALSREYQSLSAQVGETTVTSYYLPGYERGGQRALQVAVEALEFFNARFGPYPYTELDVAQAFLNGGMEFPGIVFIGSSLYTVGRSSILGMDLLVAHEVAHQWWYGVVGNNQADEPWLDESFATYSSLLYFQDAQGERAAETVQSSFIENYQTALELESDGPLQSSVQDYADDQSAYYLIVYYKGALFLACLRDILGDDDFFALMQHHYQEHKYGLLAADDFRRSIEQATGSDEVLEFYDAIVVRGEAIEDLD
jgi:hypothetical protein